MQIFLTFCFEFYNYREKMPQLSEWCEAKRPNKIAPNSQMPQKCRTIYHKNADFRNLRSKIIKKFGVKTQKSSELFAYVRKKQYLCGEFLIEAHTC